MEETVIKCKGCSKEDNEKVNVSRFIDRLDNYFKTNDLEGAYKHLKYWEEEAIRLDDQRGLLSILNEQIGYSRRINDKTLAENATSKAKELIFKYDLISNKSGATIAINIATTLSAFGKAEEGLPLYDIAAKVYVDLHQENTFEYAALLNNKATCLSNLKKYDEAEVCINKAIEILKEEGKHDGEIAVSLINLAHLIYDRNSEDAPKVEETLDLAWEYINSPRQPRDANYAFILSKCAPSLRYFKRFVEAQALEDVAKEIYGR